jgi:hypothetical protein
MAKATVLEPGPTSGRELRSSEMDDDGRHHEGGNKSPSAQAAARAIIKFATLEQATGRRSAQIRARIAKGAAEPGAGTASRGRWTYRGDGAAHR